MTASTEPASILFLKSKNFLPLWDVCPGTVCDLPEARISNARAAPPGPEREQRPPPPRPVKVVPARKTAPEPTPAPSPAPALIGLVEAAYKASQSIATFKKRLDAPPPPRKIPPFDLQDVPKAMRKLHLPMSAKLQERWFAGYENYSLSEKDIWSELDQHGKHYAKAMVDETSIKMDWVLSYPRAREVFDELVQEGVHDSNVIATLRAQLNPFKPMSSINAWQQAGPDRLSYHQKFQFQRAPVNATWGQKIASFLDRSVTSYGVPDDLTGALGAFNFYAAVHFAWFDAKYSRAVITAIAVYVRDPYEFSGDQYLGHWNARHIAIVPAHQLADGKGWIDFPIAERDIFEKDALLYPVTNKHYRDWRVQHQRGGDFMIYSDRVIVNLNHPISVPL